ncbi:MAG: hypothetical protein ACUVUC_15105 [Thermoguttaceae bacterium]
MSRMRTSDLIIVAAKPTPKEIATSTPATFAQVNVKNPSRAAHSLGITALVIGGLSVFVCWIPVFGVVVSGLGLLLGIGGFPVAIFRRGSGLGFCIGGSVLSALTLLIAVLISGALLGPAW